MTDARMARPIVEIRSRVRVNEFLASYHYLGPVPAWKAAFALLSRDSDIDFDGVIVIGLPVSRILMGEGYLEIRRMCLRLGAPKNSGSRLLGFATRWAARHGFRKVVSYADPSVMGPKNCPGNEHRGTVYLAANFKPAGMTKPDHWSRSGRDRRVRYTGPKLRFVWEAP